MTNLQFRVLYRQFLFRMVDLELLSAHAQGDVNKLFGQFASLLILLSLWFSVPALGVAGGRMGPAARLIFTSIAEHFLIATTMLVVGLFAVLSWDSTFPDRRDVLVLAPLPVRARTIFLAKVAAVATALSLTVATMHVFTGLAWPLAFAPQNSGIPGLIRTFAVYWITMFAAGAFVFCCVLGVQGLAAQLLPRRWFLRVSSFLQMAAFCLFVSMYFLQPSPVNGLSTAQNLRLLAWLPSYWFLGLFQELNGSMHPLVVPLLSPLARRAWMGLAVAGGTTAVAYVLSYLRTLRKIVEEPDIVPGFRGVSLNSATWLPRFGNSLQTALVQFSIRTLLRSRQHRMILAFYLGTGFAITIFFLKTPLAQELSAAERWQQVSMPMLASSIVMMGFWVVGTRVVFSLPLDPRANWVFRITPVRGGPDCLAARRRAFLVLSVAPVWVGSAAVFLSIWPWRPAAGHLMVLGLLGLILADYCLRGIQKIPFTCSYLPGKSNFHITFWLCIALLMAVIMKGAQWEGQALQGAGSYAAMLVVLAIAAGLVRRLTAALAKSEGEELQFEETPSGEVLVLGLPRDGGKWDGPADLSF
jgi:hypothetical protein